ncbi:MAG: hypothetical protein GQE15_35845 [Archangiaceae bacterium]|nr:hypothetical protein [Archangiaceae bacterium]
MLSVVFTLALAQTANPYLDLARAKARELKFAEAITQLQVAKQVPDLEQAQRLEVFELLAKCQIAEGNRAEADAAFSELLAIDPEHELDRDSTSPKILTVFDAVKERLFPDRQVSLVEEMAPPGRLRLRVIDPFHRATAGELVLRRGDGPWESRTVAIENKVIDVLTPTASGDSVFWFVRVNAGETTVASFGSEAAPRVSERRAIAELPPAAEEPTGLAPTKVAGIVTGAVAVLAAGVGTALQLNSQSLDRASRDPSRPPGDWADTARAAHADAVSQATWSIGMFATGGVAAISAVVLFAW